MPSPNVLSSTLWSARRPDAPRSSSPTVSAPCAWQITLSSSTKGASSSKARMKSSWRARADTPIFTNFNCHPTSPRSSLPLTKVENYDDQKLLVHSPSPDVYIFDRYEGPRHKNREGSRPRPRRHGCAGCQCRADHCGGSPTPHHDDRRGGWICTQKCS